MRENFCEIRVKGLFLTFKHFKGDIRFLLLNLKTYFTGKFRHIQTEGKINRFFYLETVLKGKPN